MNKTFYAKDGDETLFHFEISKELSWKQQISFLSNFLEYLGFTAKITIKPYPRSQVRKRIAKGMRMVFVAERCEETAYKR